MAKTTYKDARNIAYNFKKDHASFKAPALSRVKAEDWTALETAVYNYVAVVNACVAELKITVQTFIP